MRQALMQAAAHRLLLALAVASAMTLAGGLAAWRTGQPLGFYAAALVLLHGSMATLTVWSWTTRRPRHLDLIPAAVSLDTLQVVPRYYLERLAALGIFTITSLRRADPELTALGIGATPEMVHRWQARAELHLLELREDVLGWKVSPDERWPGLVPGTGAFGRGPSRRKDL